jgi:hypothetical protein
LGEGELGNLNRISGFSQVNHLSFHLVKVSVMLHRVGRY